MCLSHLIYTVRPCLIHICHATPMPCSDHAVLLKIKCERHILNPYRHGMGTACYVWIGLKRTSPFKSARGCQFSRLLAGELCTSISLQGLYFSCKPALCSHVKLTGYPLRSLVSPPLPQPCVTVCHRISTGLHGLHFEGSVNFTECLMHAATSAEK
jgi:hypothetical protein